MPKTTTVPSLDDVAQLPRDEWEDLCALLCSRLFQAHRVEDRFGRGNGLDAWREGELGVEGWQFRRLDSRFGDPQVRKVRGNLRLASERSRSEIGRGLVRFTLVVNIDAQPAHGGSRGEIERLAGLKAWAQETHNVQFDYLDVTWVRARLLEFPALRPDLFNDLAAELARAKSEILGEIRAERRVSRRDFDELEESLARALGTLLDEAERHHARARDLGKSGEYLSALRSWDDALRLVRGHGGIPNLEGEILAVRSGVEVVVGRFDAAVTSAETARELLDLAVSPEHYWWAAGNLAFAMTHQQNYEPALELFADVLHRYEVQGDLLEIARTVQQILEVHVQRQDARAVLRLVPRLATLGELVTELLGPSELTIGMLGSAANARLAVADLLPEGLAHEERALALAGFKDLELTASELGLVRLELMARGQAGRALWLLNRLDEAADLLRAVANHGDPRFPKTATDCRFNLALVLAELGSLEQGTSEMREARERYLAFGDTASAADAERRLLEWEAAGRTGR